MNTNIYKIPEYVIFPWLSNYVIRRDGSIFSIVRLDRLGRLVGGKYLKPKTTKYGYREVQLITDSGKKKTFKVHRLIAIAFIETTDTNLQVNHKDGDKTNNHYLNLEWVTPKQNIEHAERIGLRNSKGENNPSSKLTIDKVNRIRSIYRDGKHSQRSIAIMFGVSQRTIFDIVNGLKWN